MLVLPREQNTHIDHLASFDFREGDGLQANRRNIKTNRTLRANNTTFGDKEFSSGNRCRNLQVLGFRGTFPLSYEVSHPSLTGCGLIANGSHINWFITGAADLQSPIACLHRTICSCRSLSKYEVLVIIGTAHMLSASCGLPRGWGRFAR